MSRLSKILSIFTVALGFLLGGLPLCSSNKTANNLNRQDMSNEIWMDVGDYEGIYQVSSRGNIKSVKRHVNSKHGNRIVKERIMSILVHRNGYCSVLLSNKRVTKRHLVHRLVAEAFICNRFSKETVNHKNGVKADNKICNLEWMSRSENTTHAYKTGLTTGRRGIYKLKDNN